MNRLFIFIFFAVCLPRLIAADLYQSRDFNHGIIISNNIENLKPTERIIEYGWNTCTRRNEPSRSIKLALKFQQSALLRINRTSRKAEMPKVLRNIFGINIVYLQSQGVLQIKFKIKIASRLILEIFFRYTGFDHDIARESIN